MGWSYKKSGLIAVSVMAALYLLIFLEDLYLCHSLKYCIRHKGIFDIIYAAVEFPIVRIRQILGLAGWTTLFHFSNDPRAFSRDIINHVVIYITDFAYAFLMGIAIRRLIIFLNEKFKRHEKQDAS